MSSNTVKQESWDTLGYDPYLSASIDSADPNYQSSFDFTLNTQDNAVTDAKIASLSADKVITGILQSTDGKTYFDLDNKKIIVNDGTNDRVLIGYQSGGF